MRVVSIIIILSLVFLLIGCKPDKVCNGDFCGNSLEELQEIISYEDNRAAAEMGGRHGIRK